MLSQIKYFRQRMIKYLENHTVTETAIRFRVSRKTVYKWLKRYDGTLESLEDRSHKPKNSPRSHTDEELKHIKRCLKKHKWKDLILAFQEMKEKYGYTRSYGGFKRIAAKLRIYRFLIELIKHIPFPIREIQTDNGTEFTNAMLVVKAKHKTMFEAALEQLDIKYHRIRVATPRHNGKVERQNRQDEERFYRHMKIYSPEDGRKQLAVYQRKSNNYIKTCLNFQSPNQVVEKYLGVM